MVKKIILTLFLTCILLKGHAQGQKLPAPDTTTIIFKVYVGTFRTQINLNEDMYRDIPEITFYRDTTNNFFKYTSGNFTEVNDAVARKKLLRDIGIKDAFILAFKNGRRISLKDALKGK